MRAPEFWSRRGPVSTLLLPLSLAMRAGAARRLRSGARARLPVPVICCGNATAGGAGKTPLAIALAERLAPGRRVHLLARGHGGRLAGPLRVDPERHSAAAVGDEPLLLARVAPTWIGRARGLTAGSAIAAGAELLILDDGYQDPSLAHDLALLVIDGAVGWSNERMLPAGPLREPAEAALARASAVVLIGEDRAHIADRIPARTPLLQARLEPNRQVAALLTGQRVIAFAGIGRPAKFFESLEALGAKLVGTRSFADHHRYRPRDLAGLQRAAARNDASLVTTEKDWVRLSAAERAQVIALPVRLVFEDAAAVAALLKTVLDG